MTIKKIFNTAAAVMLLSLILPNFLFPQSVQITKVLDANLLQLQNGKTVRLSGIYVPGTSDINKNLSRFSGDIKEFSEKYFVDRSFRMQYNRSLPDSTILVSLYREYPSGDEEDVAMIFLKNGYAACIDTSDLAKQNNYAQYQKEAQNSEIGIWSLVPPDYFKDGGSSVYNKTDDIKNAGSLPAAGSNLGEYKLRNSSLVKSPVLKDPTLAGILSFVIPGLGQCYDEDFLGGSLYFLADGFCYYKFISSVHLENGKFKSEVGYLLAGAAVHILSIVEASKSARDYNDEVYFSLNKVKDNYYVSLRLPLNF